MLIVVLINFFLALATTISMAIMPLLMTEKMGLSILVFGLIEGSTEFLANVFKLVSGSVFDRIKNKKNIFVLSTFLASLSKLMFFFPTATTLLIARIFERLSNGLFSSPRDAFVGQVAKNRGLGLALLSCSKTLGCVAGPFLVSGMAFLFGDFNSQLNNLIILGLSFAGLSVFMSFYIKTKTFVLKASKDFIFSDVLDVIRHIKPLLIITIFFFLGRFNDGLITIYLKKSGLPEWFYLSSIGFFNAVMFIVSPIIGLMVDGKKSFIAMLITVFAIILCNFSFYSIDAMPMWLGSIGLITWGIQRVGAQIVFTSLIFKNIDQKFYGTAIGVFSLICGIGNFIASSICGHLAENHFSYVFIYSGTSSIIALFLAFILAKKIRW
ncbi:MAG: hypothetical protein RLZZ59_350 [Pseudomonadota bacterium]